MPVKLAEYGAGIFGMGLIAWSLVTVVSKLVDRFSPPSKSQPVCPALDLAELVRANTKAMTELVQLVRNQTELIKQLTELVKEQADTLIEMRLEAAKAGRAVS